MSSLFYYDVVCPYAYMAFSFLHRSQVFPRKLTLKPILLGGLFKEMGADTDPNSSMAQTRREYLRGDIARQAAYFGVELRFHKRHPVSTVNAMRLLTACADEKRASLTARLYQCYWQDNLDIDDDLLLKGLQHEFGIDEIRLKEAKDTLRSATNEAFANKIFGVPTISLDGDLYFGADRLALIQDKIGITLPDAPWKKCEPIDFYFDFSSPYSYLGFCEVRKAMQLGAQFNFKPILLGALFKEIGTTNIPMLNAHPNKTAYYFKDMADWAAHRNVAFTFNSGFPLRTVTPLRVALLDERALDPIFKAAWANNLDIGDETVLTRVLSDAGLGQENLLARAQDEQVKAKLKENTSDAAKRGVFGVPTFFVKGEKIFGQDRFMWMRRAI